MKVNNVMLGAAICTLAVFTFSCSEEKGIDAEIKNRLELVSESAYSNDWLPESYTYEAWDAYYQQHQAFPDIQGKVIAYPIEVIVRDAEGNPVPNVKVDFSADGGAITLASQVTEADGKATAVWSFDGSWGQWGNFKLTITAGDSGIEGSPIIVESVIDAPPGV